MAPTGSTKIEEVYYRQIAVGVAVERLRESGEARRLAILENELATAVVAVREGGDVAAILQAERVLLRDEYDRFANTATMKGSLEAAPTRRQVRTAGGSGTCQAQLSASNSAASCSVMAPPSCSASVIVTARL